VLLYKYDSLSYNTMPEKNDFYATKIDDEDFGDVLNLPRKPEQKPQANLSETDQYVTVINDDDFGDVLNLPRNNSEQVKPEQKERQKELYTKASLSARQAGLAYLAFKESLGGGYVTNDEELLRVERCIDALYKALDDMGDSKGLREKIEDV
jgi:hypothetical protein